MKLGDVLKKEREKKKLSVEDVANRLGVSAREWHAIEAGDPAMEHHATLLQHFAAVIEQPVFNLFYPNGVPFQELDDYP